MPYDEKRFHHYVDPAAEAAPVFSVAATGLDIDCSHYSADLLATLDAIVAQPGTRVVACVERFIVAEPGRWFYEVRLTTDDDNDAKQWMSGASWHHYVLTEANHRYWRQNRTVISKQNILPAAPAPASHGGGGGGGGGGGSSRFRIYYHGSRSPHSETQLQPALEAVHVRRFNLAYIGCLPNLKARFYREIMVRERLARMRLPGICTYLGCIVENGLVVGVALQGPLLALDEALGGGFGGIPCRDIVSTSLVHATIAMQCAAGMALKGPVRPSAVMVEPRSRSLVLADIDCLFAGPPGMLFGDLSARGLDAAVRPAVLLKSPLGHIFVRMCSRVLVETGGAREPPREIAMACRRPSAAAWAPAACAQPADPRDTRDAAV
ncbi:hypothetical protein LPJ72_005478 [Coemansia sp. Benny D160-2]|nr:hypothetical protein LPJ72_005478 [Coemansia sp. Benny D160-2]